ncbi:MAG: hypothetical protein J6T10_28160 [Methanobrevibacter sp.]|nr:hypothetical protein [Methanobrevibacter sp.]
MTKEEFQGLVDSVKGRINETDAALISDDLLGVISTYNNLIDEVETLKAERDALAAEKEELLKVNGKLFQKVGFENEEAPAEEAAVEEVEEEIKLEDIIDEKGDMIEDGEI